MRGKIFIGKAGEYDGKDEIVQNVVLFIICFETKAENVDRITEDLKTVKCVLNVFCCSL